MNAIELARKMREKECQEKGIVPAIRIALNVKTNIGYYFTDIQGRN
ncbi:MAG: hypothetical protein AB1553_01805 [Nitrospirota bacterium]